MWSRVCARRTRRSRGRRRRWRGDAAGRRAGPRDGGVRIGDAIDRGRDGDGGTRRGVVERACCSRARDGGAEKRGDCEIGRGGAAARSERGSATAGALDPACEDMFRWARARGAEFRIEGRVVREGMREARATESIEAGERGARGRGRRSWASNKSCARRRRRCVRC